MSTLIKSLSWILAIVVIVLLFITYTKKADNIGNWREDLQKTARTNVRADNTVELFNLRDYTYSLGTTTSRTWIATTTVYVDDIESATFYLEPFPYWSQVGHTFLSFTLSDGTSLAFSIEAKIEQGDTYSALRGLFNDYELALQWGFERDFVSRRILQLETNLYRYPLDISKEEAGALFVAMALETERVAQHPRFYNTLTENCTNILSQTVNSWVPNTLLPDIAWVLTGQSDAYLMREEFIDTKGLTLDEMRERANLAHLRKEILDIRDLPPQEFSRTLRALSER